MIGVRLDEATQGAMERHTCDLSNVSSLCETGGSARERELSELRHVYGRWTSDSIEEANGAFPADDARSCAHGYISF